jgi:hypothetical protein
MRDTIDIERLNEHMQLAGQLSGEALTDVLNSVILPQPLPEIRDLAAFRQWQALDLNPLGAVVCLPFYGAWTGKGYMCFPENHFVGLEAVLRLMDETMFDQMGGWEPILFEIGNIVLNACIGTLMNAVDTRVEFEVPQVLMGADAARLWTDDSLENTLFLRSRLQFTGEDTCLYVVVAVETGSDSMI